MSWFEHPQQYDINDPLPAALDKYGELGLANLYPSGKTTPGWGGKRFVENYNKGLFLRERALTRLRKYDYPIGLIMRSVPLICVDIDGKNGGIKMAGSLNLPPTLAEKSRSGNGYHLFYEVPGSEWKPDRGHDALPDIIGLIPGVDIKGTGLVYHYPHQMWNGYDVEVLPPALHGLLNDARQVRQQVRMMRSASSLLSEEEKLIVHDEILTDLAKPIYAGRRNQTLYAIGARLFNSGYKYWDIALFDRGVELGMEPDELNQIVSNVEAYS